MKYHIRKVWRIWFAIGLTFFWFCFLTIYLSYHLYSAKRWLGFLSRFAYRRDGHLPRGSVRVSRISVVGRRLVHSAISVS